MNNLIREIIYLLKWGLVTYGLTIAYGAVRLYVFGNYDRASTTESLLILVGAAIIGNIITDKLLGGK